ncbi:MAG: ABC transporter ATP-binding protein [Bacillota bacterium]
MEIKINNLSKFYGKKQALKDVNWEIGKGMYGLLGPNGAGKTTLMRIIASLLKASSGKIIVNGSEIKDTDLKAQLGYLPQNFSFYPQLTVYEAMDYLAILSEINEKKYRQNRINELLELVNLTPHKTVKCKALSGGMKQRLGIAQALINDPELLIVDEPTAGLDPEERIRFRNLLSDISVERTVILSTHIAGDIEFACDKLAILKEGQKIYDGKVESLVEKIRGFVWEVETNKEEGQKIRNNYRVVSYISKEDKIKFRLLSKEKPANASEINQVTIEDAYMGLMEGIIS